jgi:hypothetical protein
VIHGARRLGCEDLPQSRLFSSPPKDVQAGEI